MAKFKSIVATPVDSESSPEPTPLSFTPSPAAIAAAHEKGADISGLLSQLHTQLSETRQILSTIIWLTPQGDEDLRSLKTLMRKLCLFMGSVDLLEPSTPDGA